MKYKLILFDADGTLFDFEKAEKNAFHTAMKEFGIKEKIAEFHYSYEIINKAIWQEFQEKKITSEKLRIERFRRFFTKMQLDLDPVKVSPFYLQKLSEGIDLLPFAEEVVKYFHGKCEIALATNGLSEVQRPRFAASKLSEYFKHIFISEEIGFPKPNSEFFEHIFSKLPFSDSTIIVGDNLTSDIKGGNDFGIDTCWFNPQKCFNNSDFIPTYEIGKLEDLKEII
ncbi:MAG: YjjG family noncanonical pyrimidine nucleotidase [Candidatus Cloacimonetes bacterium]|nr:YjjG family noncanonical pyrimidine nucleotidase [Candidatus Cloacimonadota bacterium]MCF7814672.1 YjjG family noncanonical pyrimidine nucleotidase [Candidatus Cloacimonadota bacterium]MCF7868234.1 YjjG family noncanonical pyrimidine nucleotidase [Candidatus Cloacimonadota bacterium]MCF7883667.1 YjjG family noncanonical pyrimidine nucleotidase [Candidatus Cloacimonadota bacterium]